PGLFPDISSTRIRESLQNGEHPPSIPKTVWRYIHKKGLYDQPIHAWLKSHLHPNRYRHTLAVSQLAQTLARKHHQDIHKAHIAALLHDAGRSLSLPRMVAYAQRRRLKIPQKKQALSHQPILAHATISADIARKKFGIIDSQILNAIRHHTLGRPRMTTLEKILYLADIASEDRDFKEARTLHKIALHDLNRAMKMAIRTKMKYVQSRGQWLHPLTLSLWKQYQRHS
ncbi:MAG: bis(5'-nucleosyl)-tetraphosphatase (symmetrical) YqeK, partial [Elusimicrobia bacterium]|nr:bis(5'-nucleosyl)-tetraphosphatase (symmetrical) YqeK [Elusimicrobiota bacterium]